MLIMMTVMLCVMMMHVSACDDNGMCVCMCVCDDDVRVCVVVDADV